MSYHCTKCNQQREQGCFGPRCPGIPTHHVSGDLHRRARQELQAIERHLTKRCLADDFSLTNLWLLVDANGRGQ